MTGRLAGTLVARRRGWPWWQVGIAASAVVLAAVAVWVTLRADFLARPDLLAVQKADFILGPVLVGLYWLRARPTSRFGPLLIAFGFVAAVYIAQSSSNRWLFGIGFFWELVIYWGTQILILTFPTGRLEGLGAKLILWLTIVGVGVPSTVFALVLPQTNADFSLSGCRALCPENGLAITSNVDLALDIVNAARAIGLAVALTTIVLLIWRLVTGTPPQRRALAIGTPIALLFLVAQVVHQGYKLFARDATEPFDLQWLIAGARSLVWYGFWFALIAAQLFAGRALHRLVRRSLRRPSQSDLEAMVREPLGDPGLQLAFWDPRMGGWVNTGGGVRSEPPEPAPGQRLTLIEHEGGPAAALLHDAQLDDDPELLQAAGAVALLAAENAELDAGWNEALRELRQAQTRIVKAGDVERRRVELDLHDGVQQRLVAVQIHLALASEVVPTDSAIHGKLATIADHLDQAVADLREVSHGLSPPLLTSGGLRPALDHVSRHAARAVTVHADRVGRYPAEIESALYYCCLEGIQNASKHGDTNVHISVTLRDDADALSFQVSDDGPGLDSSSSHTGIGLQNMRDRLEALGGRLSIVTAPGRGTIVSGSVPLGTGQDMRRAPVLADAPRDRDRRRVAPS